MLMLGLFSTLVFQKVWIILWVHKIKYDETELLMNSIQFSSIQFYLYSAFFTIKLSLGALQSQKPRARTPR